MSDEAESAGAPAALRLQLENGPVTANGEDLALFSCFVVDEQGCEVPDASPSVHFACSGRGRIVGTGSDNRDPVPVTSVERRMFAGRIAVAVRMEESDGKEGDGTVTLFARASSLRSAYCTLDAQPSAQKEISCPEGEEP